MDGARVRSFLSTDGEASILNEAFDNDIITPFAASNIDYLKLGPSVTSQWQPWDVCTLFRGNKSSLAKVVREGVDIVDDVLRRLLGKFLQQFHDVFPAVPITA